MLILTRKIGESVFIGDNIRVVVLEVRGKQIRLGIEAPPDIVVLREEVLQRLAQENLQAAEYTLPDLEEVVRLLASKSPRGIGLQESPPPDAVTVATRHLGPVPIREDQIIVFPAGLPGFGQFHRYVCIEASRISPLLLLQSLDNPALAWVAADLFVLFPDYQLGPLNEVLRELKAEGPGELKVLALLTIPSGRPEAATANLMSPILINPRQRLGKQVVMENGRYSQRQPIDPPFGNRKWASAT